MDLIARRQLQRVGDWPRRLIDYLSEVEDKDFEYGTHDCFLFAVDCIKVMTEVDIGVDWRGTYTTELGAVKSVIKEQNKDWNLIDFWSWLMRQYGCHEVKINFAHRGDPVFIDDTGGNLGLGIIDPGSIGVLGVGKAGLVKIKKKNILQSWSIE